MSNKTKIAIVAVLVLAGVGGYIYWKKKTKTAALPDAPAAASSDAPVPAPVTTTPSVSKSTSKVYQDATIQYWIEKMKAAPDWLEAEKKKAIEANRTLEEQLLIDAKYMIDQTA